MTMHPAIANPDLTHAWSNLKHGTCKASCPQGSSPKRATSRHAMAQNSRIGSKSSLPWPRFLRRSLGCFRFPPSSSSSSSPLPPTSSSSSSSRSKDDLTTTFPLEWFLQMLADITWRSIMAELCSQKPPLQVGWAQPSACLAVPVGKVQVGVWKGARRQRQSPATPGHWVDRRREENEEHTIHFVTCPWTGVWEGFSGAPTKLLALSLCLFILSVSLVSPVSLIWSVPSPNPLQGMHCEHWERQDMSRSKPQTHKHASHTTSARCTIWILCPPLRGITPAWRGQGNSHSLGKVHNRDM